MTIAEKLRSGELKNLIIGGYNVQIILSDFLQEDEESYLGFFHYDDEFGGYSIKLRSTMNDDTLILTFFHELVHAILDIGGYGEESKNEALVQTSGILINSIVKQLTNG